MPMLNVFIPLQKADLVKRQVWGFAAVEQPDSATPPEIMDYAKSKPHFMRWSAAMQKASQGKSLGNVRAMHGGQMLAVGRVIHLEPRDLEKAFYVGVEVVDNAAWEKVQKGVFTGFSIGGKYGSKWPDALVKGAIRYEAIPNEISLVDLPCIPGATYEVIKIDGASELRKMLSEQEREQMLNEENAAEAASEPPAAETKTPDTETPAETPESAPGGAEGSEPEVEQASLNVEAVRGVVINLLMELGLVQATGAQPMSMAVRMDGLSKAIAGQKSQVESQMSKVEDRFGALQKMVEGQSSIVEELRKAYATDIAQIVNAVQMLEKRGGAGPVIRDLGAITQQGMADLQKAAALKDLLPGADPLTRQNLQAEITRLEIKAAQTQK